ncbi:hypothetical protein [Paenibacillus tuaregi]|uniref:hypothetical protein n=1 Tax=Paenibacillus tuaregi TaxID=1816681 RepID=UPI00083968BA|nr:hypothetical protein [Paenibacillus tuaregi]
MSERLTKAKMRIIRYAKWVLDYWYLLLIPYIATGYGLYYWMNNYIEVIVWISGPDASGGWKYFMLSFLFMPVFFLALGYWMSLPLAFLIMFVAWNIAGRRSGSQTMRGYLEKLSR